MRFQALCYFVLLCLCSFSQDKIDLLIFEKKFARALSEINQQIDIQPSSQLYFKKGIVLGHLQNYFESVNTFQKALEMDAENQEILIEIAESYSALANYRDAAAYYSKAFQKDTTNLVLAGKMGKNYINVKDFRNAYRVFKSIFKKDSSNVFWNKQLAFCAFQNQLPYEAIRLYNKVIEANPRDLSSYINLIRIYQLKDSSQAVFRIIEKGFAVFPENPEFTYELANHQFKEEKYKPAKEAYEKYFELINDSFRIVPNYGITLYFTKNEDLAIPILEKCMFAAPNDPFVLCYLSLCHKKLKDFDLAEKYMKAAIEAATPSYLPEFYHHLGQIFGMQRRFPESIATLKKAYEDDQKDFEILFEIATTYEEFSSDKTLALNFYNQYLKIAGENAPNRNYVLNRISTINAKIKEDQFFREKKK